MKSDTYKEDIPSYALCYLINGDSSGLEQSDIDIIDRFMNSYYEIAEQKNGHVVVDIPDDEESFFAPYPAFGLPCDAYSCNIVILWN